MPSIAREGSFITRLSGPSFLIHEIVQKFGLPTIRLHVPQNKELFSPGMRAVGYHLVETGKMKLRFKTDRTSELTSGSLVAGFCGDSHAAHCVALTDSEVLRIDRVALDALAADCFEVQVVLRTLHARELASLLASIGPEKHPRAYDRHRTRQPHGRSVTGQPDMHRSL